MNATSERVDVHDSEIERLTRQLAEQTALKCEWELKARQFEGAFAAAMAHAKSLHVERSGHSGRVIDMSVNCAECRKLGGVA